MARKKTQDGSELTSVDLSESFVTSEENEKAIQELTKRIESEKKEHSEKNYSVKLNKSQFNRLLKFIREEVQWKSREALGVIEIENSLKEFEKSGIKDGYIYMKSLTLQATHYFISKMEGSGVSSAKDFISLFKSVDEALNRENQDSRRIKDLEKQLVSLQQGIELE